MQEEEHLLKNLPGVAKEHNPAMEEQRKVEHQHSSAKSIHASEKSKRDRGGAISPNPKKTRKFQTLKNIKKISFMVQVRGCS